jgi:hypothetical protein
VSASTLRAAAALIRERANAATPGPWVTTGKADRYGGLVSLSAPADEEEIDGYGGTLIGETLRRGNRAHIASWPPAVAFAVADLIDTILKVGPVDGGAEWDATVTLAKAYLGVTA